jgi:hypothetical protein
MAEHKYDDGAGDRADREENQPSEIGLRPIAQRSEDLRPEIAAEIADGIDGRYAGRRSCAA